MDELTNAIEQSLLKEIVVLYLNDLETEIHSYRHIDCLACSKRAISNIISRHQDLIRFRQRLLFEAGILTN
ncbi:hypothetical protein BH10CYA1_BH10CYA1_60070 [soil metagenome]